jgi:DNA-binding CsgD family transcriptional regulator
MPPPGSTPIEEGYAALRAGDSVAARAAFDAAAAAGPPSGAIDEGRARVAYLDHDYTESIELWTRAYGSYREAGDALAAVRVARTLAYVNGSIVGDAAVMRGWLARATTLLADAGDTLEAGWVGLNRGMFEADRRHKEELLRDAFATARRFGDADLEFAAIAYLGASLVMADRTEEGMELLDEALAAAAGREIDDFLVLQEIFCQLFTACEHAHDVVRADQWIRVGEEIATRRNLPAVSAFCRTHYGGVLTAAGRWAEADVELTEAVRLWALGHRTLQQGALARLAELRVRQGRIEEAEQLLAGIEPSLEAARPQAGVHLAYGRIELAGDVLERALDEVDPESVLAASLWALLVEVHLAAGRHDDADATAGRIATCAQRHPGAYVEATAALAHGRVCLATSTGDPCGCLREALAGFSKAQTPHELAEARMAMATALADDRPEVALAEARAALDGFDRLRAARRADAAAALLRSMGEVDRAGPRTTGILTKREEEVLDLLGLGLSNPEIAERLYISRKTVEHHVGRILAKLGLRSRAEAAVYATKQRPAEQ